jgi:calcium-dependent protein kinase
MEKFAIEINIMTKIDHPHVIHLYEIFEDNRYLYLVMEECSGGELFDRIIERINAQKMFTEKEAAFMFKQLMSAICYCHGAGICHRDLKPENLLFLGKENDSPLKVIDFGLSRIFGKDDHRMSTKVGTAYYVSPEVLAGNYDEKCDIWSAGVILYILLCGDPPFNGANDHEIYRRIASKKYSFPSPQWDNVSNDAKDLISHMLSDPDKRYTAEQVLKHTWVENLAPNSPEIVLNLNVDSMKNYTNSNKLKKAVLTFIASRLKEDDIKELKDIFMVLDKNKDGTLTLDEIKEGIEKLKKSSINVEEIFKSIDTDSSGVINYTEFLAATIDKKVYMKEERLYEAFRAFDKDGSGKISRDEIKKVMKADNVDISTFDNMIESFDTNGDGEIDYNEFISMMNKIEI